MKKKKDIHTMIMAEIRLSLKTKANTDDGKIKLINMISTLSKKPDHRALRMVFRLLILVTAIFLFTSWIHPLADPVMAGSSPQVTEDLRAGPTPTPAQTNPGSAARTSPVVGILVLLAPLLFIAWKSRGVKEPKITASCCAPVIDENKRPFQIRED